MRGVLDHFYLKLRNGCFAVSVGNLHYQGFTVGYVKYCPTIKETSWSDGSRFYERLVKTYSPVHVRMHTPWFMYIPQYGSKTPVLPDSEVLEVFDPRLRLEEIVSNVNDAIERDVVEFIESASLNTGIYSSIGVTGSVLVKIHNYVFSDMDFVVYDWRSSLELIDFIESNPCLFNPLSETKIREWCSRVGLTTGLTCRESIKFYRRWRRGLFKGREYSLIYNDGLYRDLSYGDNWCSLGSVEGYLELDGGLDALNYPSRGVIDKFSYVNGVEPGSDPDYVLSFEALYVPLLYEGGRCYVKGLLQVNEYGQYRILVGVVEDKTFMRAVG